MKRKVKPIEYNEATPEVKEIYDDIIRMTGNAHLSACIKVWGRNPQVLRGNWEKCKSVLMAGIVSPLLKQLILYVISMKGDNLYCVSGHGYAALGIDPSLTCSDLDSLTREGVYEGLPSSFRTAIHLVSRLALESDLAKNPEIDVDAELTAAGFSAQEIDELMALADMGSMMNIFLRIHDIPPDRPFPPPDDLGSGSSSLHHESGDG